MTELKMKEMQIIHWFGCPNLNCTKERIHLVAMLATDAEMKRIFTRYADSSQEKKLHIGIRSYMK